MFKPQLTLFALRVNITVIRNTDTGDSSLVIMFSLLIAAIETNANLPT